MMKTYARIQDGRVVEIIDGALDEEGIEIPIERRFHPDLVATLVDVSSIASRPVEGDVFENGSFAPYVPAPPTEEAIAAANKLTRDNLFAEAITRVAPLQDAVDLGVATSAETDLLAQWKQYRVAVNRVDLTLQSPTWPSQPMG